MEMIPLPYEGNESYTNQTVCDICKKEYEDDNDNENYRKVQDHFHYIGKYRGATYSIYNLRYKTTNKTPAVIHNRPNYGCHFIIRALEKYSEVYKLFSIKKKKENKNGKIVTYKMKFIDSIRYMESS